MDTSAAIQLAETIQTASIQPNPDPAHDLNPSTSASSKQPVKLTSGSTTHQHSDLSLSQSNYDEIDDLNSVDDEDDGVELEDDDIPYDVLRPVQRRTNLPPLPDMRFEQSYLKSIELATTNWQVAYITIRDQVILPLAQGTIYSLALLGWRHWNRATKLHGEGVGARVRRWWWGVNNWSLDSLREGKGRGGNWRGAGRDPKLAARVGEFYEFESSAGGD